MLSIHEIKAPKKPSVIVKSTGKSGLLEAMGKKSSYGRTENGALTFKNTGSLLLDFFAQAAATRNTPDRGLALFEKAFSEDNLAAVRLLFYMRDVRGGQGERRLFRDCIKFLGTQYKDIFEKIVKFVPEYGRWDDIFFSNEACAKVIGDQLAADMKSEQPSLLAKWLPTINASSENTKAKAKAMVSMLGLTDVAYRHIVRDIRKKIKTVEELMSGKKWGDIEYSKVPSRASMLYKGAFMRHDADRYASFIESAKKGEVKINAGTLYPYEIFDRCLKRDGHSYKYKIVEDGTMDALWKNLPDMTRGKNAIVVADTSGSMCSGEKVTPMSVSVSLALYFAEKNNGPFKDHFITFSNVPKLQKIVGNTLAERMRSIITGEVSNTNLQAVFELLLGAALSSKAKAEDMPATIYIVSDMEFDSARDRSGKDVTNFDAIKSKYRAAGYDMPNVVFWNVNSRNDNNPVRMNEYNVALVSGCSTAIFRQVTENKSPYEVMMDVVNSERYNKIVF